jgi:type I restriction enzyme S subunit
VTSEYPVYRVKKDISAEYLKIVLRTPQFTDLLKAIAAGHSGRKRVQPGELEDVLIPVPSLDQQRRIATEVQRRREQAVALREEAERVVVEAKAEVERMILENAEGQGEHR